MMMMKCLQYIDAVKKSGEMTAYKKTCSRNLNKVSFILDLWDSLTCTENLSSSIKTDSNGCSDWWW